MFAARPPPLARASPFARGARVLGGASRSAAPRVAVLRTPRAGLFDFLKPAAEAEPATPSLSYICLECGYVYRGDLNKEARGLLERSGTALAQLA